MSFIYLASRAAAVELLTHAYLVLSLSCVWFIFLLILDINFASHVFCFDVYKANHSLNSHHLLILITPLMSFDLMNTKHV